MSDTVLKRLRLLRGGGPLIRVGHRGAAALAPANTLPSIEAALETGVDMVELDVYGLGDGSLVLGHSAGELETEPPTLEAALALLAERAPETAILADLKSEGHEAALVEALRRHRAVERTLVSAFHARWLRAVGNLDPSLARSLSYPRDRLRIGHRRTLRPVVLTALLAMRSTLPHRIGAMLARAGASVATLNYRVISRAVVERCHSLGAAVFVWTVDDPELLARLDALGVDAVIADDPRIFRAV